MNLFQILLEIMVGRLVLDLPKEDLKEINKMILRNLKMPKYIFESCKACEDYLDESKCKECRRYYYDLFRRAKKNA